MCRVGPLSRTQRNYLICEFLLFLGLSEGLREVTPRPRDPHESNVNDFVIHWLATVGPEPKIIDFGAQARRTFGIAEGSRMRNPIVCIS